jgi:hypothetical protein
MGVGEWMIKAARCTTVVRFRRAGAGTGEATQPHRAHVGSSARHSHPLALLNGPLLRCTAEHCVHPGVRSAKIGSFLNQVSFAAAPCNTPRIIMLTITKG